MEEKKIGHPSLKSQEAQEEAKGTVAAMTSKVEATLHKDDGSIDTMEDSIISKQKLSKTPNKVNYTPISSIPLQPIIKSVSRDEASVASSVTMESLLSRQSRTDARIDKMDSTMNQILHLLQSGKVSSPNDNDSTTETGGKASSGAGV